jgi:hypothetical protein
MMLLPDGFNKFCAGLEVTAALFFYFFTMWVVAPHAGEPWANGAFTAIIAIGAVYVFAVSPFIHKDTRAARGLGVWRSFFIRRDNLRRASIQFGLMTLAGIAIFIMLGVWLNAGFFSRINWTAVRVRFLSYLPYALLQDLFFYGFIFQRMLTILPRPALPGTTGDPQDLVRHRLTIAVLMGIIFSACHLPNSAMMLISLLGGILWTSIFYMTPNMLALVLCHALLGTTVSKVVCFYTRVGPFYMNNDRYVFVTVIAGIQHWFAHLIKLAAR